MLNPKLARHALFGAFYVAVLGCARPAGVTFQKQGEALTVRRPALYPETIAYSRRGDKFLLGSIRDGAVYEVDQSGKASRLVDDPRLCSVLGIAVDAERRRLWAVNSDVGASVKPSTAGPKQLAGVGVYDLDTGKPLFYVDLAPLVDGPHLLNGIALDRAGSAYVTDSFSPVIYEVNAQGRSSVLLRDERFSGEAVNLNGVVVHPGGYLLAVKKSDGSLFKVPLKRPADVTRVARDERLIGGDGLTLIGETDLVVIANRTRERASNSAFSLSSADGWATATVRSVQELGDVYPTTAVLRDDTLYVLHSKLDELLASPSAHKSGLRREATIRSIARVPR